MATVVYDDFLAQIYDYSPYFGQARFRNPDKFNHFYYHHLNAKKRHLLEFGSSTGMLSIPLAAAGHRLDCVDISPFMQQVLAEKLTRQDQSVGNNIRQVQGDATIHLGEKLYDDVVMTESFLIALPDFDLQMAVLENCFRNLKPGGRIYTDFTKPLYKSLLHKKLSESTTLSDKHGNCYLMDVHFDYDEYTQVDNWDVLYTRLKEDNQREEMEIKICFRYLFPNEIRLMMEKAGFTIVAMDVNHCDGIGMSIIAEKSASQPAGN